MTITYQYEFTIANVAPGTSGQFPLATQSTTYLPTTSVVFQQGDVISVKHNHPLGHTINTSTLSDAQGSNPDPSPIGAQASGSVRNFTWSDTNVPTSNNDYLTRWYFNGTTQASGQGSNAYSQEVRYRRVKVDTFTVSPSSGIESGDAITFTVSGLAGLSASGTEGERLYISVYNSSGALVTSGITFDSGISGTMIYGKVGSTDLNTTMTLASTFSPGTYTAHLSHYNGSSFTTNNISNTTVNTGTLNRFFDPQTRMRRVGTTGQDLIVGVNFVVDVNSNGSNQTTNPMDFPDIANAQTNTLIESSVITVTGLTQTAPISINQAKGTEYRVQGGVWRTQPSTINNGQTVQLRNTSPSTSPASQFNYLYVAASGLQTVWMITTSQSTDTTPSPFAMASNVAGANRNSNVTTAPFTPTGYNAATSISINTGSSYSIGTGAFTTTAGNISPGQSVRLRTLTGAYSTTFNAELTIGGVKGTNTTNNAAYWTVATMADPGTTSNSTPGAGSASYGLRVNSDNLTELFGPSKRAINYLAAGSAVLAPGEDTGNKPAEGMTANNSAEIGVSIQLSGAYGTPTASPSFTVTRTNNNFKITNTSTQSRGIKWLVKRY